MATLHQFLKNKGYGRVRLKLLKSNHYTLKVLINGTKGTFLLDTGASDTCVAIEKAMYFALRPQLSEDKATSASSNEMHIEIAHNTTVSIGNWSIKNITMVLFDMQAVNQVLQKQNITAVDGIIGANILRKSNAIIDYNKHWLYLKN